MGHAIWLLICLLVSCGVASAQDWVGVFVPEGGTRLDYFPKKGGFKQSSDGTSYKFEFIIPESGDIAKIRLIPIGKRTDPSADYSAVIAHRSDDMIVLVMVHGGTTPLDKFEVYTLYPQTGIAFNSITSAYIGSPAVKAASATNPNVPAASASVFPLRRIN
jgi:hypothetical protein